MEQTLQLSKRLLLISTVLTSVIWGAGWAIAVPLAQAAQAWSASHSNRLGAAQRQNDTLAPKRTQIVQAVSIAQVTGVQLSNTANGIEVTLISTGRPITDVFIASHGETLIIDIIKAQLNLSDQDSFRRENPTAAIAAVTVAPLNPNSIRVTIIGQTEAPTVAISQGNQGLILNAVTAEPLAIELPNALPEELETVPETQDAPPSDAPMDAPEAVPQINAEEGDALRIVVTGEGGGRYVEPTAATATRTDTLLRDVPQSIQVIPQAVLEDQQVFRLNDALRNVSGVVASDNDPRGQRFIVRGFEAASVLRDGFRLTFGGTGNIGFQELSNIQQIEVLKGPAAILFGALEPGGVINLVSEHPLSEPFYDLSFRAGNRGLIEPSLDISGPLTEDGRVLYRLNALYRNEESFRDFDTDIERFFVAPIISLKISDRTDLLVDFEYYDEDRPADFGLVAIGDEVADIPFDRNLGEPNDINRSEFLRTGYQFEHRFNDEWKLRNAFHYTRFDTELISANAFLDIIDEPTGTLFRNFILLDQPSDTFELQTNVVGEFSTGPAAHRLLVGVDLFRREAGNLGRGDLTDQISINIFDPVYGLFPQPGFEQEPIFIDNDIQTDALGVYLQDQITLLDNLKLLVGFRYETFEQETFNAPSAFLPTSSETTQTGDAFSPRVGLVYQPIEAVSLFTSYSRSFSPNTETTATGDFLEPERGEQFEAGAKAELLGGRFAASLAYFNISLKNVATPDPDFSFFSIATGRERSQGMELDLIGEILPGWNLIANYAYTDARITEDNSGLEGNRRFNVPRNNFNLWTTYDIQHGPLQGMGFGIGVNYVGQRFGDNANSFELNSYFLTNAAISYRRDNWRAGLNIRNLFDIDYIESSNNSRVDDIIPGEDFTIVGSVSIEF